MPALRTARALAVVVAFGCATTPQPAVDYDPAQGMNRAFFSFNDGLDRWVLEPVAKGWAFITPEGLRVAVDRFFVNLAFPRRFVANLLQAEVVQSGEELGRFVINTTVGFLGFFDPATPIGLGFYDEDFGQAFGAWGSGPGPYLHWPIIGPSSPRDTAGWVFDFALSVPFTYLPERLNKRSLVIEDIEQLRAASLDYYAAVRNGYVQQRWYLVRDLDVPEEGDGRPDDDDLYSDPNDLQ